jgi:WD40 repeat protein
MQRVFVLCLLFLTAAAAHGQEPPPGFEPLFNGKDLSGWGFRNCNREDWVIENGILSTRTGKPRTAAWVLTETQHDDFELRLEYLVTKRARSGLAIRTAPKGAPGLTGIRIALIDDSSSPRAEANNTTGAIAGVLAPAKTAARPVGEWNQLHLIVNERKLKVVLNGITVQDADLDELKKRAPKHTGLKREAGSIGLQTRQGVVKFRNVVLKPLSEPPLPGKITLTLDAGGHTAQISKVFFTHDGKSLVTSSADRTVRVWDVASGEPRQVLRPPGVLSTMALSPTEDKVAVASLYPEGKKLYHVIYLMRLADGQVERVLKGHKDRVVGLAFSGDGKHLASSATDKTVRVWSPATGKVERVIVHGRGPGNSNGIALSPNGDRVVCLVSRKDALVFEVASGKLLAKLTLPPGNDWYKGVAWSPDGKTIATSGWGRRAEKNGFYLWNPDGTLRPRPEAPFRTNGVAFSKDGRRVLLAWGGAHKPRTTWDPGVYHRGTLVDLDTGKPVTAFAPRKALVPGYNPPRGGWGGALSPDGKLAATLGGEEGLHEILLWQTADGTLVHRLAARSWLRPKMQAAWSADGQSVAWGNPKGKTRPFFHVGELRLGTTSSPGDFRGPSRKEGGLTLERQEPNKRYFEMQVVKEGKVIARLRVPHRSHVPAAKTFVGPDRVAMSGDGGGFFLYDVASQKTLREFKIDKQRIPATSMISSVAASPTRAQHLATIGIDQMLRIWALERDHPLLTLYVRGQNWIIWTEEGYYAASPGGERLIGWQVDNGIEKASSFYTAERFRKQLWRPDVIKLVLEKGSVTEALKAANAAAGIKQEKVAEVENLLPPKVTLTLVGKPLPLVGKAGAMVTVQATATAEKGQSIQALRLMLDGRGLGDNQYTKDLTPRDKPQANWKVEVPAGKHELRALVRGESASDLSEPIVIETELPAAKRPNLFCLSVGLNYDWNAGLALKQAEGDAGSFLKAVQANCAGANNRYGKVFPQTLVGKQASRKAILAGLKTMRQQGAKPGDLAVLFFSGHGVAQGREFYLVTADTDVSNLAKTALSGSDLRQALSARQLPCQVLLIFDACQSGQALNKFAQAGDEVGRALAYDDEASVTVLAGAMAQQAAREGRLTPALVQVLKAGPGVFFDPTEGVMNVQHAYVKVLDLVSRASNGQQTPVLLAPWTRPPLVLRKVNRKSP